MTSQIQSASQTMLLKLNLLLGKYLLSISASIFLSTSPFDFTKIAFTLSKYQKSCKKETPVSSIGYGGEDKTKFNISAFKLIITLLYKFITFSKLKSH
jgi:hypothetical protein